MPSSCVRISLLTYNVYLRPRPVFLDQQMLRARRIAALLCEDETYDAVVLCEVFARGAREALLAGIEARYPHRTALLGADARGCKGNGGVMIVSRHPIVRQAELLYGATAQADDQLVNKGAVYADLGVCHIFATHANAKKNAFITR